MSSSQRTYGRKRKDEAEEKFDALFSNEVLKKPITIEIGKVKKQRKNLPSTVASITLKNGKQANFSSPAAISVVTTASYVKKSNVASSDPLSFSPVKAKITRTFGTTPKKIVSKVESQLKNSTSHTYNSISNTKYDMLFKKNEKNASDKFDALFGDELATTATETDKVSNKSSPVVHNPDYESLFGFADSSAVIVKQVSENKTDLSQTVFDLDRIPSLSSQKSPIKLSGITGASMKTVGGKVVLNIQKRTKSPRKRSLIETKSNESSCSSENETVNTFLSKDVSLKLSSNDGDTKKIFTSLPVQVPKVSKPLTSIDDKLRNTKISLISNAVSDALFKILLEKLCTNIHKYFCLSHYPLACM